MARRCGLWAAVETTADAGPHIPLTVSPFYQIL
jgi:hypothetical protein